MVNLTYVDQDGAELLLSAEIGEYVTIDTATIFRIKDALGYSSAVLGALGTDNGSVAQTITEDDSVVSDGSKNRDKRSVATQVAENIYSMLCKMKGG